MLRFVIRRAVLAVLVCLTVLVASFALTRLSGDLAVAIAGPNANAEDVATIRRNYGLDRPVPVQFLDWAADAARGDLGRSYLYHAPVGGLIARALPVTLTLGVSGLLLALVVSIPLGVLAAAREGSGIDRAVMLLSLVGQAMPGFWLGLLLVIWFGLRLQWLPVSGADDWTGYVAPAIVLAFSAIPALLRLTRAGMIEALAADYIRTARAKGLGRLAILFRHALRNAAMPVVAVAAVQFGFILGGSVVVEQVFALHGVGYLAWESISKNDFPVVQAIVLFLAVVYVGLTLAADLLNAALDPRLRTR